ncbi:hypothetical protein [Fibrobacter sp.]
MGGTILSIFFRILYATNFLKFSFDLNSAELSRV